MIFLCNAFSINMLSETETCGVTFSPITLREARELWDEGSFRCEEQRVVAIGHADTARVVGRLLGEEVEASRISVRFRPDVDTLIVAQLRGPRLPEGATELPEGATIEWWLVH